MRSNIPWYIISQPRILPTTFSSPSLLSRSILLLQTHGKKLCMLILPDVKPTKCSKPYQAMQLQFQYRHILIYQSRDSSNIATSLFIQWIFLLQQSICSDMLALSAHFSYPNTTAGPHHQWLHFTRHSTQ